MLDARDQGMLREYYNYISTSLDLERVLIPHVDAYILSFFLTAEHGTTHTPAAALTHDAAQLLTQSLAEIAENETTGGAKSNLWATRVMAAWDGDQESAAEDPNQRIDWRS